MHIHVFKYVYMYTRLHKYTYYTQNTPILHVCIYAYKQTHIHNCILQNQGECGELETNEYSYTHVYKHRFMYVYTHTYIHTYVCADTNVYKYTCILQNQEVRGVLHFRRLHHPSDSSNPRP